MKTETTIDKSKWGPGPWQTEPDRVEFECLGLPCLMVRQQDAGHWCGYVAVPPGHPWHGMDFAGSFDQDDRPEVHGGLTYSEKCQGKVCHVPKLGEPDDVWWLGFDCAHAWDFRPGDASHMQSLGLAAFPRPPDQVYRSHNYVKAEVARLAAQAKKAAR